MPVKPTPLVTAYDGSRLDLRLIVITDQRLAAPRTIAWVVEEALLAGAPAVQLRDKQASSADLFEQARRLRELTSRYNALLFINDRLDVAHGVNADGAHLGPDDIPLSAARAAYPALALGYSTDSPARARDAQNDGAAYIGCGAVFATTSKVEVVDEQIGPDRLRAVVESVSLPVVAIGGITLANVMLVSEAGAAGCAVIKTIMAADQPGRAAATLLRAFER